MKLSKIIFVSFFVFWALQASSQKKSAIKIGYLGGLSGPEVSQSSMYAVETLRLLIDEVNKKGGISGHDVELLTFDNKGLAHENEGLVNKAKDLGVDVLTGVHYTNDALLVSEFAEKLELPVVVTTASHPKVVFEKAFTSRVCFNDHDQVEQLSLFASEKNPKSVLIIKDVQNSFGIFIADEFQKSISIKKPSTKSKIINVLRYESKAADIARAILSSEKPDIILFTTQAKQSAEVIKILVDSKLKTYFLGTDAWESVDFLRILKGLQIDVPLSFTGHWMPEADNAHWNKVKNHIQSVFNVEPSPLLCDPVLTYDSGRLILEALKKAYKGASRPDSRTLARIIRETTSDGILGRTVLQKNGESNHRSIILNYQNGVVSQANNKHLRIVL